MANSGKPVGRGVVWREREILDLLSIWGEEAVQEALANKNRNIEIYDYVAKQMAALGHRRSAVECRTKTKAMRYNYKRVLAHNMSGNVRASCPFYGELDRILGGVACIRSPRVAKSLNLQVQVNPPSNQECTPGSEELFSHDLETIKQEDICHSTPLDSGESSSAWSQDPDEITVKIEEGVPSDIGETGIQRYQDVGNSTTEQQDQEEQDNIPNAAEVAPERRLSASRNRKRRVSVLSDVARQMLRQSALDAERSEQLQKEILVEERRRHQETLAKERNRHQQKILEENRRFEALLEEGRLGREAFQHAMDRSYNLMFEAVDAIKTMTELMVLKHSGETSQVGNVNVQQENTSCNPEPSKPSDSNCPENIPETPTRHKRPRRTIDRLDV
ncbi:zinc finger and SCAN domain-containing protein 29-like isoform X2 [Sphaerodactylus townsendi]|uniref:zinc finger and SCAN domain-containing protein 29-like isoform X2 n=1 Tax=Sphaerodactylus townsendi TaxID=933632 RepID=UPI002026D947|nr:zinc finger and SCAN domain-containing protein 29-like isoform X2 [Sphaerodactylus townsendi]